MNNIVLEIDGKVYQVDLFYLKEFVKENRLPELLAALDDLKHTHTENYPDNAPAGPLKQHIQAIFDTEILLGSIIQPVKEKAA
jgi:hypothetical protein